MANTKQNDVHMHEWTDLFRVLAKGAYIRPGSNPDRVVTAAADESCSVAVADLAMLAQRGLIKRLKDKLYLTEAGENWFRQDKVRPFIL